MWKLHCPCSQFLAGKLGPNFGGVGNNWIFCGPPAVSSFTINHVQSNCVVGSTRYVKQSEIPINDSMVDWYPDLRIYVIFFFFFYTDSIYSGYYTSVFVASLYICFEFKYCCAVLCSHLLTLCSQCSSRSLQDPEQPTRTEGMESGWWGSLWGVMDRSVMFWFICYTPVINLANLFFLLTMPHLPKRPKILPFYALLTLCSKIQGLNLTGWIGDQLNYLHHLKHL